MTTLNRTDPLATPVPEWLSGQTAQRRVEWNNHMQAKFTVRKKGDLWVAADMGVYFDTDEIIKKISETVEYWDGHHDDEFHDFYLTAIRLDLTVQP